jgi:FkbM family methyltransferase
LGRAVAVFSTLPIHARQVIMETVRFLHHGSEIVMNTHDQPDHLFNFYASQRDFYELDLLQAAGALYRAGSHVIDIGANIGNHSVYFAKMLSARVLAFEPFEPSRDILVANLAANQCADRVGVEACALGDRTGRARAVSPNAANLGMVSVTADPAGALSIRRLDDCLAVGMDVSILKVDVEGGEMPVLRGAERTLAMQQPHIFAEAAESHQFDAIRCFLDGLGYRVVRRYCATPTYLFSV